MKCNKCGSENVTVQAVKAKSPFIMGFTLLFGGLGLMIAGLVGAIIGVPVGVLIGAIVKALVPTRYDSLVSCQNCGYSEVVSPKGK